jgi:hypothetical protein
MFAGNVFSGRRGKFLQVQVTIEDEGVFTAPWTATLIFVLSPNMFAEVVCAENQTWLPGRKWLPGQEMKAATATSRISERLEGAAS